MTVRPTWWQPVIVVLWSILLGSGIVIAALVPAGANLLGAVLFLGLLAWIRTRAIRLEVTERTVGVRQSRFRPARQVARDRIRAIHYYPDIITFRGPDNRSVMQVRAEWSLTQMIEVAAVLRVPVYDNRRCLKLVRARLGNLVYDPFDDPPRGR
ncbi:MAG TPA: hypothetical protein VFN97_29050 [Actinospica sp.]|nr:hypothetical protein [Actinospica sp.]